MNLGLLLSILIAAGMLAACQSDGSQPNPGGSFRSNANKALTDDPVKSLQKY